MSPRLVLLNGIPGSGKSTLANAWCASHAADLPLALDIDVVRSMIGGWQAAPIQAGLAARALTVAAIRAHLESARDVLVPQYLRRTQFIDELRGTAASAGAIFIECAITIDIASATRRLDARGAAVEGSLDRPLAELHDEFERFIESRPDVARIHAAAPDGVDELDRVVDAASRYPK